MPKYAKKIAIARRITIPTELMNELKWKVGDLIKIEKFDNGILIKRVVMVEK